MKKILLIIMSVILTVSYLTGCTAEHNQDEADENRLHIVTTIFPEYDWVRNILGDNPADAEVTLLLNSGVDLHSYQPAAADILKVSLCDLFIYVGGESDEWAEDILSKVENRNMKVINLLEVLGDAVREEEIVEGMQEEEHEDHDHENETEYDEHVWLSLKNAAVLVESISHALMNIDSDHAAVYRENAAAYISKLNDLDLQYQNTVSGASFKTLLFGDRFPFRYLTDDYGLEYYAAFAGCSAETEASFETVIFLAQKVDELSLPAVIAIEGTNHRIAETIVRNTRKKDQQILTMNSMQSVTARDVDNGVTYLSLMAENLSVLKNALE